MIRPFSPLYFIKANKIRCTVLCFVVFLTFACYLGGIYVTNPRDNFKYSIENLNKFAIVNAMQDDENAVEFTSLINQVRKNDKVEVLFLGKSNSIHLMSIMGFVMDTNQITFKTVDDFKIFNRYMKIIKNDTDIKDKDIIMSRKFANNIKMEISDLITPKDERVSRLYADFHIKALTNEDGYTAYYIDEDDDLASCIMILNKSMDEKEFLDYTNELNKNYNVYLLNYETFGNEMEKQFEPFNYLYFFVVLLLAFVLGITSNAVFVIMFQKRKFEFAIYRALGYSKLEIYKKIIGELLLINFIGLVVGGIIFFVMLYLANNLLLYPNGRYLLYYNPIALIGLVICNITIFLPIVITRCRMLARENICEY